VKESLMQVINDEHEPQEGYPEPQGCLKKRAFDSITDQVDVFSLLLLSFSFSLYWENGDTCISLSFFFLSLSFIL